MIIITKGMMTVLMMMIDAYKVSNVMMMRIIGITMVIMIEMIICDKKNCSIRDS